MERDDKGRFRPGNKVASKGGKARAAKLGKRRRRQIAKLGYRAMVDDHFYGLDALQKEYFGELGRWNSEKVFIGTPIPVRAEDPGKPADWLRRRYPSSGAVDVDFY